MNCLSSRRLVLVVSKAETDSFAVSELSMVFASYRSFYRYEGGNGGGSYLRIKQPLHQTLHSPLPAKKLTYIHRDPISSNGKRQRRRFSLVNIHKGIKKHISAAESPYGGAKEYMYTNK